MPTSILATKLYIPSPRAKVVIRPRLIEQLNDGFSSVRKLTIISAPAGFGKTTLVSEWIANCGRPTAWLSLDEGDNNSARFLTYLVIALQTIAPKIGEGVLGVLQASGLQSPPIESILTCTGYLLIRQPFEKSKQEFHQLIYLFCSPLYVQLLIHS